MSNALAIPSIDPYGLASIRQVAFQSLLSDTSANSASPLDNTSSIVQLSPLAQVLGAGAALQSSLEALQENITNATPSTLQTAAQTFVTSINNVQQSLVTAVLGDGVPTELPQNLTADTVLNTLQLENIDLAAVAQDATIFQTESNVLNTLPTASTTPANTSATRDVATSETPSVTTSTTTTTNQNSPQLPEAATVDRLSADQAAADATRALQVVMADSALRNVIFNPVSSALSASWHMSGFVVPIARIRTGAIPAEIPGAVLPINRIEAISSYQDTARSSV